MKTKLYSLAHIETARSIFPDRFEEEEWLDTQWTDKEINTCKSVETNKFIANPSLATYPRPEWLQPTRVMPDEFHIVDDYCKSSRGNVKTFLSVACGLGEKELRLASNHPNISFVAIDNAPYVELLNEIAKELGIKNITFRNLDLRKIDLGKFDIVYSFGVIYCLPDEYLTSYFELLIKSLSPNGVAFVGCGSYLNLIYKMYRILPRRLLERAHRGMKQTGWMRDIRGVKRYLPEGVVTDEMHHLEHSVKQAILFHRSQFVCRIVESFSRNIFPVSNSSYLFMLRKVNS